MKDALTPDPVVSVTGYVIQAGNLHLGLPQGDPRRIGVILECGERDIEIAGLDRQEAKALGKLLRQEVTVRITPVTKP